MEREKPPSRRHQLDLVGKKFELDQVFDSIINRLPDLCMPPSYRLAGEDDFFDCTRSIKLVPFKKQAVFETCISPELYGSNLESDQDDHSTGSSSTRAESTIRKTQSVLKATSNSKIADHETVEAEAESSGPTSQVSGYRGSNNNLSKELIERKRKFAMREAIKKRYSKLKVKRRIHDQMGDNYRVGYDRLFSVAPAADYPYLNPIPECMLTRDNIDNLREIIVSAVDIEWKMLTPVRPHNDYEEKYFDRLIQLHRYRYKARLETGYFNTHQMVPFKHTRHTYLVQYGAHKAPETLPPTSAADSSALDPKRKFSLWLGPEGVQVIKMTGDQETKLNVPKLTLTSDETHSRPIVHSPARDEADPMAPPTRRRESWFDYEHYSRFSRQNLRNTTSSRGNRRNSHQATTRADNEKLKKNNAEEEDDDMFEDRVEEILSKLVNINMNDAI